MKTALTPRQVKARRKMREFLYWIQVQIWKINHSEELIDRRTFNVDCYEKRLKPVGTKGMFGDEYVPQLKINGVWKTLCKRSLYRIRQPAHCYYFLMTESCNWCSKMYFGSSAKCEYKATTKEWAVWYFDGVKKECEELSREYEDDSRRKKLQIINLS